MSAQSSTSGQGSTTTSLGRPTTRLRVDPNVVVLDRFEDVSPLPTAPLLTSPSTRRSSLPEGMQYLSLSKTVQSDSTVLPSSSLNSMRQADEPLLHRFRHYVVCRLLQPHTGPSISGNVISSWSSGDIFHTEARHFHPVSNSFDS